MSRAVLTAPAPSPTAKTTLRISFLALAFCAALSDPAAAETPIQIASPNDGVLYIPSGDVKMAAAMRKAQATLGKFLALAKNPRPSNSGFTVKVPLPAGDRKEYVWLQPFRIEPDGRITGVLNNKPVSTQKYKKGQTLTYPRSAVADWGYIDGGRMMGNFTTCVLFRREPRAEALISSFGLSCNR